MGDGHHVWAAAEWVLLIRNSFLREEGDRLILASGIFPDWLEQSEPISFGPAPTAFGEVSVSVLPKESCVEVQWQGEWRAEPPVIEVCLPGIDPMIAAPGTNTVVAERKEVS
jgi:hypothetical protein